MSEYDVYDVFDIYDYQKYDAIESRLPKRYIRDAANPFEVWSEDEFKRRYRFSKDSVLSFILPKIETALTSYSNRGLPVSPAIQLLICLRFYASASFQTVCGDLHQISQGTVSNIVTKVSDVLSTLTPELIKFPENNTENQILFQDMGKTQQSNGIPGVIGVIDCTHVRILSTPGHVHSEAFRNRKSYFSFNVQAVAGPRGEFLDIIARYAGSIHDSRIFQMSPLFIKLRDQTLGGILLGDNGYPCLPFILTPLLNPQTRSEQNYNNAHIKTRNIVERMFGVWKKRFPCLSCGMGNKLTTIVNIIVSCAVLHNIAILCNDQLPEETEEVLEEVVDVPVPLETDPEFARRQDLIDSYFATN